MCHVRIFLNENYTKNIPPLEKKYISKLKIAENQSSSYYCKFFLRSSIGNMSDWLTQKKKYQWFNRERETPLILMKKCLGMRVHKLWLTWLLPLFHQIGENGIREIAIKIFLDKTESEKNY